MTFNSRDIKLNLNNSILPGLAGSEKSFFLVNSVDHLLNLRFLQQIKIDMVMNNNNPITNKNIKSYWLPLSGILFLAVVLRLIGVNWGMPYIYHPDERFIIARGVYFFTGDLNPHFFNYPSLLMYIMFIVNIAVYAIGFVLGKFNSVEMFTDMYRSNPGIFYIPNRVIIVIFAVLTLYATFKLADYLYGRKTAFLSLILFTFLPVHIIHSHFVTSDVPCILFVVVSFYYSIKILDHDQNKNYILAAVFAGLAAGTRYNSGVIILCVAFAHVIKTWLKSQGSIKNRLFIAIKAVFASKIFIAGFLAIFIYLLTTPYTIFDFKEFWGGLRFEMQHQRIGHGLLFVGIGNKILYEIFSVFQNWGGSFLLFLMIAASLWKLVKLDKYTLLFFFWLCLHFAIIVTSNVFFIRYSLNIIPFCLILTAHMLVYFYESRQKVFKIISISFTGLVVIYLVSASLIMVKNTAATDPRTLAKQWIDDNIKHSESIGIMSSPTGMKDRDDPPIGEGNYTIFREKYLSQLINQAPTYLIISYFDYISYLRLRDKYDFSRDNYYELSRLFNNQTNYRLVKEFDAIPRLFGKDLLGKFPIHDMMYTFGVIKIYRKT